MKRITSSLRGKFLAGILVTVPVIATFIALRFLFLQLDALFGPLVAELVGRRVPGLGLLATVLVVFASGFVATNFVGRRLIVLGERVVKELPFVRSVYKASKDIVHTATLSRRQVFREVVMVEYPRLGMYAYGFVTSYATRRSPEGESLSIANVFIPGPPVPTTGVLVAVPVGELFYVDVSVEEALKLVLSGGMVSPSEFRERPPADRAVEDDADVGGCP